MTTTAYTDRPWVRHYDTGVTPSIAYPDAGLSSFLASSAEKFPDHTALLFYGRKITYLQLDRLTHRFAQALAELGAQQGDRVALMLPNLPQMVIAYYGALRFGAIAVPTNPLYLEHELEVQLADSGASILVALDLFYPRIEPVLSRTQVKHVILCGVRDFLPFPRNLLYSIKARIEKQWIHVDKTGPLHDFSALVHHASPAPFVSPVTPDDIAILQYTGGTTGTPKGAMLTHRNLTVNAVQSRTWLTVRQEGAERILAAIPFFHVYGMTTAMNLGILIGAEIILLPKFHTKEVLQAIHKHRPTIFPGIQAMYLALGNYPDAARYDLTSLRAAISGAGPLMREVQDRFEHLTGARIVEGYGLSEASPVTHANPIFGKRKPGTIGVPWPDVEAAVVDMGTGEALPPGQPGELIVRGPQVMKGYWNKPEETAHALRGGWLHTGDIATMDRDGFFTIVDRIKDMIKTGGENVYPREIEEVLFAHPKVREAVVIGIPQDFMGEEIKAFVVLKEGATASADEIIGFCAERLSRFKVPKKVALVQDLPKTLVGKVLRRVLREEEIKKMRVNKTGP